MVEAAASAGYRFTEADVLDALRSGRGPGATTELSDEQLAAVSGGLWRAGGDPIKYMEFKLKEVRISSVIA
jgi:bacteriocin-like protein